MPLPGVRIPNILPSQVRHAAESFGGWIGDQAHTASVPAEQGWQAFAKYDPADAAVIRSFYPDSPANLINLGTLFVPGAKGGRAGAMPSARPTPGQASMLKAIYQSSRGKMNSIYPRKALYQEDPSTAILRAALGGPVGQKAAMGQDVLPMYWATNPLLHIYRSGALGPYPAGKIGPGEIPYDVGGVQPRHLKKGMDVPPYPGTSETRFPTTGENQQKAAADLLFRMLMGMEGGTAGPHG